MEDNTVVFALNVHFEFEAWSPIGWPKLSWAAFNSSTGLLIITFPFDGRMNKKVNAMVIKLFHHISLLLVESKEQSVAQKALNVNIITWPEASIVESETKQGHLAQKQPIKSKSNQTKSIQFNSIQIKSNQIKSNQIKSNQIKSNQIK